MAKKGTFLKISVIIVSIGIFNCSDQKFSPRPYPVVNTYAVTNINADGATLNGEIFDVGNRVSDHGFTFGLLPGGFISDRDIISLGTNSVSGKIVAIADRDLEKGKTYYVKAYAVSQTSNIVVYGQEFSFVSAGSTLATFKDFKPKNGKRGDTVVLAGSGFSDINSHNSVTFGDVQALVVKSSANSISCIVQPATLVGLNSVSLVIGENSLTADTEFTVDP